MASVSLLAFAAAAPVVVRANEYAWDLEARFVLGPEDDQSLYGVAYFVYAFLLLIPALLHLVSLLVAAYGTTAPAPMARTAMDSRVRTTHTITIVAYVTGVVAYALVCAMGLSMALSLGPAPADLQTRAVLANSAPLLIVAVPPAILWVLRRLRARPVH